jgi:protein O-GlcNAc transferase
LRCFEEAWKISEESPFVAGSLAFSRNLLTDWRSDTPAVQDILAAVVAGNKAALPFAFLSVSDLASAQLQCARTYMALEAAPVGSDLCAAEPYGHERLRVGYLSGDFRDHALAYLMTGVFEQHDRGRFEIFALSLRAPDPSPYGARIAQAVGRFIDLSALGNAQAAAHIRSLEIDILVDLVGYTQGARSPILAHRPAPIQVNYLGFPATLAAPYIDYLIADEYLIPQALREHYSEQIVYLPECFQANDDRRALPAEPPSRAALGLPDDALVLCCFNNSYKLTPTFFSVWMRLLHAHPHAVLWLVGGSERVQQNLRREAQQRGIAPERLHFAPWAPYEQHLARLPAADLFLDTLPFNGGTTVSDALWAGLPVLSVSGEALAARMGGSLLRAIGLPELIARDLAHYEQLAGQLLADPARLAALRSRLLEQRRLSPLFNTARFTRHLEAAYTLMYRNHQERRVPEHFAVPADE